MSQGGLGNASFRFKSKEVSRETLLNVEVECILYYNSKHGQITLSCNSL